MAQTATIYRLTIALSDVDRGVYETLDLRLAQHPSESMRYMLTRTLAYCLNYEDGIAFSKGGLSSTDEPPVAIVDPTGLLLAWIDVGVPSAERLHKATKAARRVAIYTHFELTQLRREASSRIIHKVDEIEVWRLEPSFLGALEERIDRHTRLELVRSDGCLYATVGASTFDGTLERASLT